MKKLLAILLASAMILGLAACGTDSASSSTTSAPAATEEKAETEAETVAEAVAETVAESIAEVAEKESGARPFKYGFISWGTADEHGRTLNAAVEWAVNAAGGEVVADGSAISAETTVAAAENLISAGCDIIAFCTYAGESTVPTISDLCRKNGVYWTMWDTTISDAEVAEYIKDDPYFVGTTAEDNVSAGYDTMKTLAEAGATNVLIIRYGTNIPTCDERCDGALKYIEEAGNITVADDMIIYSTDAAEYKSAVSNALLAHPEVDSVFLAGSGSKSTSVAEAFRNSGKTDFHIGAFDYFDAMGDMLKSGELAVINGGHMVTGTFSALMTINTLFGTPLSDEQYNVTIPYLTLKSYEDYEAYKQYASEGAAYTDEEMKAYLKVYNPDLTLESFQEGVSKWSVADIMARKGN